ncbi:WG repeat-containing protein [Fluviicola sp.]|uniref:WG repeat-containing protein n=1 Tax=Fluviicola sp. TaxID=1917219 RepID=UPI0031D1DE71
MTKALLFFGCMLSAGLFAQNHYQPFKIDNQFILADTNGNIPFSVRFDEVQDMISHKSEYIVRAKGKEGVVMNGKYVFPCEYDRVLPVYLFRYHLFSLEKNGKKALGTTDGVIHSGFEYEDIRKYTTSESPPDYEPDYEGNFLFAEKEEQFQLFYNVESGKTVLLTKDPVDNIQDWKEFFVFRKGKQEALYHFDTKTFVLKEIIPFSNQYIQLTREVYTILDQTAKTAKTYTYEHVLTETRENVFIPAVMPKNYRLKKEREGPAPLGQPLGKQSFVLANDRENLLAGRYGNFFNAFQRPRWLDNSITRPFQAKMSVSGAKDEWEVSSHFYEGVSQFKQKDTLFKVEADGFIGNDTMSSILLIRKGKYTGALDSHGNEILPAKYTELEHLYGNNNSEWLVVREANRSLLLFYNPLKKWIDTIFTGGKDDQFEFYGYFIRVKQTVSRKTTRMKLLQLKDFNLFKRLTVSDENEYFDSIVPDDKLPVFFKAFQDGKAGMLSNKGKVLIPFEYDSVTVNGYYFTEWKYGNPRYNGIQPVFSAYINGKQHVFHPTGDRASEHLIHTFADGSLSAAASISDDAMFAAEPAGNGLVHIYSIATGKKLTREPVRLDPESLKKTASVDYYWFVSAKDQKGKDVFIGQNGAWFVLPDKN